MPFKSEAQRRWMYTNKPKMAKRWEAETSNEKLPDRIKKKKDKTLHEYIKTHRR